MAATNKKSLNLQIIFIKIWNKMTPTELKANDIETSDVVSMWLLPLPLKGDKI